MRSLWILVAVMSLSIGVEANHEKASIVIKSGNGVPIVVQLDGRWHQQGNSVVHIKNVYPGRHHVKIYRARHGQGHHGHHGSGQQDLIFRGQVHAKYGFKTVFVLHHGHLDLVSQRPIKNYGHGYGGHGGHGGNGNGYSYGPCSNHGGYNCGCAGYPSGYGNGCGYGHDYGGSPNHCSGQCGGSCGYGSPGSFNGYYSPVPDHFFRSMMNRSKRYFIDDDKAEFFQRELGDNYVTNKQVETMVDELFFEPSKYKLMTGLYDNSAKPKKYRELSKLFTFNNTRKEFEEYVESKAKINREK